MMKFKSRIKTVQKFLSRNKLNAVYISNIKNIRYLTGFTGSYGFVLITKDKGLFFTDFRYMEQAGAEVKSCEVVKEKEKRINTLRIIFEKLGIKRLCFEKSVVYESYEMLKKLHINLLPQSNIIENMRKLKDKEEVGCIKKAAGRAEKAFLNIKPKIRAGATERELALRLEEQLKKEGCRSIPFDIIVASGKNSAMPHAKPTEKKLGRGDFVIIDWGGEADGYYSDITRTFLLAGGDAQEKIKIYNTVNNARRLAVRAVKKNINTLEIDRIARDTIKKAGYGNFFGHGTGHGVGLDVHEFPRVSWTKGEKINNGMVFTVEPGIYIPGKGGVRIEDMVAFINNRTILLTTLSREIEIIP